MKNSLLLALAFIFLILTSCTSEYEKLVKSELATGVIHEDLLLGLKMGQTQKKFYEICWELNSTGLINQGPSNEFVSYLIPNGEIPNEEEKVTLLFYGIFDEDKIMRGLTQRFSYVAWAPWNDNLQSGPLLEKVKEYYIKKYGGNDFIEIDLGLDEVKGYVKVDGNRQITVYRKDVKEVAVKIEDTRYKFAKDE